MPASEVSVGLIAHRVARVSGAQAGRLRRHPRRLRPLHPARKPARRRPLRRAPNPGRLPHRHAKRRAAGVRFSDGALLATRARLHQHRALKHRRRLRPRAPVAARFNAGVFRGRNDRIGRSLRATRAANPRRWVVSSVRLGNATRRHLNQLRRRQYKRGRKQFKHSRKQFKHCRRR